MSGSADRPSYDGPRLNVRARLVLLVLAFLVPGLLVTGFLLWDLERAGRQVQERQLLATARAMSLVVDRQIGEQAATLQALSTSPSLKRGDWRAFHTQAREAVRENSWVVVRAHDGPMRLNTRVPFDAAYKGPANALGAQHWSGTRYGAAVSNLFVGSVVPHPVIVVRRSVTIDDGQSIDLSVITRALSFAEVFRDQGLPRAWTGTILDATGRVVARSRGGERYVGQMASSESLRAIKARDSGIIRVVTLDGIPSYAAFDKLPGYQWTVFVAVPAEEIIGAARRSLIAWLGIGALLLSAAVVFAVRVAGGVATPVEQLARAATDWVDGQDVHIPGPTGLPETDSLGIAFAAALDAVEARDAQQTLLINELNHRVKNTLATVQSIALHSRRANASADEFHSAFEGRLLAMSAAHDILTRTSWEGAALEDIIRAALRPFIGPRLVPSGPRVQIGPTTALNLSLILYELATNAAKYGALSADLGRVDLTWRPVGDKVEVSWVESAGPPAAPPSRKGFGSRLIERAARDLQPAGLEFDPAGVRCRLTIDLASPDMMRAFPPADLI